MTAREKMQAFREERKATYDALSEKCGVSPGLIKMVEKGEVTHPLIVEKLQKLYKLTDEEAEELLPINYRPHGPCYDPDRYVDAEDIANRFRIIKKPSTEIDDYIREQHGKQIKNHLKRRMY